MILELILLMSLLFGIAQGWDKLNNYLRIFFISSVCILCSLSIFNSLEQSQDDTVVKSLCELLKQ